MSERNCGNCNYCIRQQCRRHAPTLDDDGRPKWPPIYDLYLTVCGDWEGVDE